jgi:hypothetical protein
VVTLELRGAGFAVKKGVGVYTGQFLNGRPSGSGKLSFLGGDEYEGDFWNGQLHGRGIYRFKNEPGRRYVGEWKNNRLNGVVTAYLGEKIVLHGVWRNDRLVIDQTSAEIQRVEAERRVAEAVAREKLERERAEMISRENERAALERARIEREGDGSEDDLNCKQKKLTPPTEPYKACRKILAEARERKAEAGRRLAEIEKKKREEQEQRTAERQRQVYERQEKARLAREAAIAADPYYVEKQQCRSFGFKDKTEKFGECVLELSRRSGATKPTNNQSSVRGDGSADDQTCAGYGYRVGTAAYSDCRLQLDMARRDYEREMRAYEAEKAAYERRVAEAQAEQKRRQQQRQAQYGFCVAQCSAQPGSTALGCMSRCGAASAGLSYDPGAPPARPSGRTTYVINGQIINCRTLPSGSVVTCN